MGKRQYRFLFSSAIASAWLFQMVSTLSAAYPVLYTAYTVPPKNAEPVSKAFAAMFAQAESYEKQGQWAAAWDLYRQILRRDKRQSSLVVQAAVHRCRRHMLQARRTRNKTLLNSVLALKPSQALNLYVEVLQNLQNKYVDSHQVTLTALFQQGVQEMRFALEDEEFLKEHRLLDKLDNVAAFKTRLEQLQTSGLFISNLEMARAEMSRVTLSSYSLLLRPSIVVLEFICGACHSLDEYTTFLPYHRYSESDSSRKGRYVGIGVRMIVVDNKLYVDEVAQNTLARDVLKPRDRILRIDGRIVDPQMTDLITEWLQGEEGTTVELDVLSPGELMPHVVKVQRQQVDMRSIETYFELKTDSGVGYIKLTSFHESTLRELKEAIFNLQGQTINGLRALIIDLRNNPGGDFQSAVDVARLFLTEGIVVISRLQTREDYHRVNNPDALTFPLVVLVDGETASAAEIVAGALKDHGRAVLVGQTTFGKGSRQAIVALRTFLAGLQVTIAKLYSPQHIPYNGRGVVPHIIVDVTSSVMGHDPQLEAAYNAIRQSLPPDGNPLP